jgi:hypothetical protein
MDIITPPLLPSQVSTLQRLILAGLLKFSHFSSLAQSWAQAYISFKDGLEADKTNVNAPDIANNSDHNDDDDGSLPQPPPSLAPIPLVRSLSSSHSKPPPPPEALLRFWAKACAARKVVVAKHGLTADPYEELCRPLIRRARFLLEAAIDNSNHHSTVPYQNVQQHQQHSNSSSPARGGCGGGGVGGGSNGGTPLRFQKLTKAVKVASRFRAIAKLREQSLAREKVGMSALSLWCQ